MAKKMGTLKSYTGKMDKIYHSNKRDCWTNWDRVVVDCADDANNELDSLWENWIIQYFSSSRDYWKNNKRIQQMIDIYKKVKEYYPN